MNVVSAGTNHVREVISRKRARDEEQEPEKYKVANVYNMYTSGLAETMRDSLAKAIEDIAGRLTVEATAKIMLDFSTFIDLNRSVGREIIMQLLQQYADDVSSQVDKTKKPQIKPTKKSDA